MTSPTTNHLLHLLGDIERAVTFLAANPARREIGSQARNPNRPGSREPISLDVVDLRVDAPAKLTEWVRLVWEERDGLLADPDTGPTGQTVTELCPWLRARAAWIVDQPWSDELMTELGDLRSKLARAPGSPLLATTAGHVPCTRCGGSVAIRQHDAGRRVEVSGRCAECGHAYDEDAIAVARARQVQVLDWQPVEDVLRVLHGEGFRVTAAQVTHWGDRDLVPRQVDQDTGRRTYLADQVRERARRLQRYAQAGAHVAMHRQASGE